MDKNVDQFSKSMYNRSKINEKNGNKIRVSSIQHGTFEWSSNFHDSFI